MWNQRSIVNWRSKGDRNTKYFHHHHATSTLKKKRFCELKMLGSNGMINTGIAIVLTDYYKKMFSSSNSSPSTSILSQIPRVITKYLNV